MKRILVIEDDDHLRNNICEILEHFDYRTQSCRTGEEAITIASEFEPQVILCDIMLPGINGYQVLTQLRKIPVLTKSAFIFLTAKASRNDIRAGMDLGADDYLIKPFSKEELINSVNTRMARILNLTLSDFENPEMNADSNTQMKLTIAKLQLLTAAEKKILCEMADGQTSQQIADKIFLSRKTVENHRANISKKLKLKGPNSLINFVYYIQAKNILTTL